MARFGLRENDKRQRQEKQNEKTNLLHNFAIISSPNRPHGDWNSISVQQNIGEHALTEGMAGSRRSHLRQFRTAQAYANNLESILRECWVIRRERCEITGKIGRRLSFAVRFVQGGNRGFNRLIIRD